MIPVNPIAPGLFVTLARSTRRRDSAVRQKHQWFDSQKMGHTRICSSLKGAILAPYRLPQRLRHRESSAALFRLSRFDQPAISGGERRVCYIINAFELGWVGCQATKLWAAVTRFTYFTWSCQLACHALKARKRQSMQYIVSHGRRSGWHFKLHGHIFVNHCWIVVLFLPDFNDCC